MIARVIPLRPRRESPPCGAGTQPGGIGVPVCGRTPARPYACGNRCDEHRPQPRGSAA